MLSGASVVWAFVTGAFVASALVARASAAAPILIDLEEIFPMKLSQFEISNLVESYDKKTAEN